jgi:hypothetical protein
MKILGRFSLIVLSIVFILFCFCPGGEMDQACAAQSSGFQLIVDNKDGIVVKYYTAAKALKMDTCFAIYYNDATDCWRLDSNGIVLREKWSKQFPRIKETWLLSK